ncbi:uncharacterized protein BP5553_03952 [Venustampulla echinocandica]|uniref:Vacuolar calcium ion transporter n=1 Tax=Venustampulla echinocandica TaxID=2656787 RepID=A0A370TVR1_9HELO|nr:uncharacterized protein BP5553_03952 [Venustampulla echinocandica]RDL39612.1 hypothetical protein BP5553_03952 [Venustampulla echinocandica]
MTSGIRSPPIYPEYCHELSPTIKRWCPLRASDVHALDYHGMFSNGRPLYHHGNHPVKWVRITGVIVAVDDFFGRRVYTLDDSSGMCIECTCPAPPSPNTAASAPTTKPQPTNPTKFNNPKTEEAVSGPSTSNPKIPWDEVDVGVVVKLKGCVTTFRDQKQVELIKAEVLRTTDQEIRCWNEVLQFRKEVLRVPWAVSEKHEEKCRRRALKEKARERKSKTKNGEQSSGKRHIGRTEPRDEKSDGKYKRKTDDLEVARREMRSEATRYRVGLGNGREPEQKSKSRMDGGQKQLDAFLQAITNIDTYQTPAFYESASESAVRTLYELLPKRQHRGAAALRPNFTLPRPAEPDPRLRSHARVRIYRQLEEIVSMTSTPNYRRELHRHRTGGSGNRTRAMSPPNGDPSEHTALLGDFEQNGARRKRGIRDFLDSSYTPGMDSENRLISLPAHTLHVTKITLFSNYVNVLLVFVPLGIVAGVLDWDPMTVFILNFFAIVPLAAVLSFATEEISIKLGETMGGLLNATFGNAVELIVSIVALTKGEIGIVQSSMLGSILSNILLVLGCCFLAGGIRNSRTGRVGGIEQGFNATAASTMSSLMAVASASLIIPATLYAALSSSQDHSEDNILILSRGTSIILLILYVLYLVFQLRTHSALFIADHESGDDQEEPKMSPWAAAAILVVVTVTVALCAEYLVNAIEPIVETTSISKTFIGLILLPIVGNAAEHATAVVVAVKDKMDLAMGVAIGSSMQIALLLTPFLVILGWIIGIPMTLHFQTFETVVFFLSVLVVTYVIGDGKSNYLEGAMLIGLYLIIALAFLVYPDDAADIPNVIGRSVKALAGY